MSRKTKNPGAGGIATGADNKAGGLWIDRNIRKVSRKDAAWFAKRPFRSHRVRYATQAEIEESRMLGNTDPTTAGIFPLHVIVRQFEPGFRTRGVCALRRDWSGCDEDTAERLWEEMMFSHPVPVYLVRLGVGGAE